MRRLLIFFPFILICLAPALGQTEFKAAAPKSVVQGSRFQLVYSINDKGSDLRVPDLPDFQTLMGPSTSQSSSMQIINGQVSRSVNFSFTYILRADKTGSYTIPPATITVDGKTYESNSLTIEVIKNEAPSPTSSAAQESNEDVGSLSGEDLFITITANKKNVYRDEPLLLTTKIYTRVQLEGISDVSEADLRDFIVQELPKQNDGSIQWSMQNIDGRTYQVGTFNQKVLYPQKTGTLRIEPSSIEFLIRQRTARQSPGIFGDFFDSYRTVKNKVKSKALTINVKPLPTPRPADFSGIVGDVTLQVSASKTEVAVNDGITLKAVISGLGNHKLASNPTFKIPSDFDVFDPKITNNITETAQGGKGSRIVETLIIPRHSGTFEIPGINYTIFNPKTGHYKTLKSKPISLNIERGEGEENAGITAASPGRSVNREDVKFLGKDIRYIKTNDIDLRPVNTFLFGSTTFVLGYVIPLLLFILIYFLNQKRIKENADIRRVKNKRANKVARKRLNKSAALLKKGDQEGFYDELSRALWGYVSDKLSIPPANLTKDNVRTILLDRGAKESVSNQFLEILDTCEYARYSPKNEHSERSQLYQTTLKTISELENSIKKKRV
ncbi:BatD family protein [Geofilum sp. OHC36d9]|uniref:BatD family protein n=1 Tax=Geofilum sp. OHC36d9 TaxID=3458413 RepID=UPI0040343D19